MTTDKFIQLADGISLQDIQPTSPRDPQVGGHVIFRDGKTGEILHAEDNLVLMRTRVWLFEQLFGARPDSTYSGVVNNNRTISLFSIGSGGSDIDGNAFSAYTPKFNDRELGRPVPFMTIDPDKPNNSEAQANPSIVTDLTTAQTRTYYMSESNPDGTKPYFAKRFKGATPTNPLGSSKKWVMNTDTGEVAFSLALSIEADEARGNIFNELGLWLGEYVSSNNTFKNLELATRICFSPEALDNLSKSIDIEYIMYI